MRGEASLVKALVLFYGSNLDFAKEVMIDCITNPNSNEALQELCEILRPVPSSNDWLLFTVACRHANSEAIRILIRCGADYNQPVAGSVSYLQKGTGF